MNPISILLVDNNLSFRQIVTRFLREHFSAEVVVVGIANQSEEALTYTQDMQPQVILLDLGVPGMTNFSTIARLRQMLPEVRIISMCLVDADGYRQAALSGGANDFISKTALTTDLLPAIRQVIQTSSGNADQKHLLS